MTFGWEQASSVCDLAVASQFVSTFYINGNKPIIDTARIYAGGATEGIVGNAILSAASSPPPYLCTKAHPSYSKGLSSQGIKDQLQTSLGFLKVSRVDEYYLHQPDPEVPLLDSLKCLHEFVLDGSIKSIGLSK